MLRKIIAESNNDILEVEVDGKTYEAEVYTLDELSFDLIKSKYNKLSLPSTSTGCWTEIHWPFNFDNWQESWKKSYPDAKFVIINDDKLIYWKKVIVIDDKYNKDKDEMSDKIADAVNDIYKHRKIEW